MALLSPARKNPHKFDPWSIFSRLNKGNASILLYSLFKNLVFLSLIRTFVGRMIVCIAEKPSVARDIARIIGATSSHDGYMEGNGFQVTWTFGHLCTLKEPHDYTPMWRAWSLTSLPMIPERFGIKLIDDQGIKKQFGIIEGLMQKAERIVNCGDAGQEGELIQRWVM